MSIGSDLPAPASTAIAHPVWFIVTMGVGFFGLMFLDAVLAALTGRGLYQRMLDLVAKLVDPIRRVASAPASVPATETA